ncbi:MAG: glycosyltransferase family 4 protein [candidate division WOR-3 bacterium]
MNKILHLSTIPVWVMGKSSGMPSVMKTLKYYDEKGFYQLYIYPSNKNFTEALFKNCRIVSLKIPEIFLNQKYLKSYHLFNKLRFIYFSTIYPIKIKNIIKNFNPDFVYAHLQYMPLTSYILFRRKKPIFVRYYGLVDAYKYVLSNRFYKFEENLLSFRLNLTGYILVNDGTAGDEIALKRGVDRKKILYLINGIDNFPSLTEEEKFELKKNLKINEKPVFLFLNRLSKLKGVDLFLNFLENFYERKSVTFLIIGDGDERENMLNFLDSEKLDYRYIRNVKQNETYKYFQISDLFLSFNVLSSLNNPVLESIKNKTPVLSLKRGFKTEFMDDYIFSFDTVEQMANFAKLFLSIIRDQEEMNKIKVRLKNFEKNYIWSWEDRMNSEFVFVKERLKNV